MAMINLMRAALVAGMGTLVLSVPAGAAETANANADANGIASHWHSHTYDFQYMGFTSVYSCDGLESALERILKAAGARPDFKVVGRCTRYDRPDRFAGANLKFATLQPASADTKGLSAEEIAAVVPGVWKHVQLSRDRPIDMYPGDCELLEQFRDVVLPMFTTRNIKSQLNCMPHQENSFFNLEFDVLTVPPAPKAELKPASGSGAGAQNQ